jgi:hypothetical protein
MEQNKKPLGYLGGDIMSFGSNLARQYEYDKFLEANLPVDVYSPVQNKSINDKSNMTEEENNHLAEKITEADIERLWNSDFAVMCPEQSAIGTMCELGCLYGWKYMADRLFDICGEVGTLDELVFSEEKQAELGVRLIEEISRIYNKNIFAHYFDIRTNHLNEKDWRRSFSINQLLYGMILACTKDHMLHENFDEVIEELKKLYLPKENN